jgi:tetratricopeptide (TPR) repeat protein
MKMFTPYTKKLLLLVFLLYSFQTLFASTNKTDSLILQEQTITKHNSIDSLKQEVEAVVDDSLKAPLYSHIASEYLKYDTISNKKQRRIYQNEAIKNTISAIHYYSRYDDTTGLRMSFDVLAKVYHAQHKYPQAKWFILQSNTLSRAKNDNPNVIASLIELSSIKTDIKDYTLAMRDLNEALKISSKNHYPQQESEVQLHFALFYNVMKNYTKASIAMRRHDAIVDSVKRDEEARLMAKLNSKDSLQQVKKKLYTISNKKLYKASSSKRIALL